MKENIEFEKGLKIKDYQQMINDRDKNLKQYKKRINNVKHLNRSIILGTIIWTIFVLCLYSIN